MTDLSQVPTDQLLAFYSQQPAAPGGDLSGVSTEQLLAAYNKPQQAQPQLTAEQLLAAGQRRQDGDQSLTWSDVGRQAVSNAPASAGQFVGDIYHAVTNPSETLSNIGTA